MLRPKIEEVCTLPWKLELHRISSNWGCNGVVLDDCHILKSTKIETNVTLGQPIILNMLTCQWACFGRELQKPPRPIRSRLPEVLVWPFRLI